MAQRERLGHLKFMQRAKLREEESAKAKEEEAKANSDHWVVHSKPSASSCIVIVEGDPKPSSVSGRMSFRSFNPSFEVSSGEAASSQKPGGSSEESSVITSQKTSVTKNPRIMKS